MSLNRRLREAEWYENNEEEVAPGYRGRLSQIVEAVTSVEERHQWLPQLPEIAPDTPPLGIDEGQRLLALIERHGAGILEEHGALCPDPALLPAPDRFAELVASLIAAERASTQGGTDRLADLIAQHDSELCSTLIGIAQTADQALRSGGLSVDVQAWKPDDWRTTALADGLAGGRPALWELVRRASDRARAAQGGLLVLDAVHVEIPELGATEVSALITAGLALQKFLREGGRIRKRFLKPEQRNAETLLTSCTVNGQRPTDADGASAVVVRLQALQSVLQLNRHWQNLGLDPVEGPMEVALSELLDRAETLRHIDEFATTVRSAHDTLLLAHVDATVRTPEQWEQVRRSAVRATARLAVLEQERILAEVADELPELTGRSLPELAAVHRAMTSRDPEAYEKAVAMLTAAYHREADRREARKLLDRLTEAHPELSRRLLGAPTDPAWGPRLATLGEAWAWRQARGFLDHMLAPGRERQLEDELGEVSGQLQRTVEELAGARALWHCLTRMTAKQRQALHSYASSMSRAGSRSSTHSKRHLKAARSAMRDARGAVPAWVMPLKQVAAMIDPIPDTFDVVVVDEASQVALDGLMLLWLAPRVVIVGDDQQCAPVYTATKHERLVQRLNELLPDLVDWQRDGFDPKSNLYDLLSARFNEVIRLTEHFRCMPEIIKWSSDQFYDKELIPLRQYGADRLPPLRVVHVPEGRCEGLRERMRNEPEAERIVATLQDLIADPAYAESSFGIITLRYGQQARLLDDLIDATIDPALVERHRIRVGTAAQFQGDERDVVLLSMVIDGNNTRAVRSPADGRRFNVAASRARNQMWLFSSVTADQLPSRDLRRSLMTYMQTPPALQQTPPELADVAFDERRDPFESLFEQRVFLKIRERGYHVIPQWAVGAKRVDLVVTGEKGRLAVECDGSPYHSSSEQIRNDLDRERELRRAGWRFWRVRSSQFALGADSALQPLWERLDSLGIQPGAAEETVGDLESSWAPVALDETAPDSEDLDVRTNETGTTDIDGE